MLSGKLKDYVNSVNDEEQKNSSLLHRLEKKIHEQKKEGEASCNKKEKQEVSDELDMPLKRTLTKALKRYEA